MAENGEVPIIPNDAIRLNYGTGEDDFIVVAASHDTIQKFTDSRLNHLRYWEHREGQMKAVWLALDVLVELEENGVPVSYRESITQAEWDLYEHYVGQVSTAAMAMIEPVEELPLELMPGDPIDAAVQSETAHLDAELNWFLGEWEQGHDGTS